MSRILLLLATLLFAAPLAAQAQEDTPLPPDVVARLNGEDIPKQAYLEYLYLRFGKRGVTEMVGDILVNREADAYGVTVDEAEVQRVADEREAGVRRGLDEATFLKNLERNGQDYALYRTGLEREVRVELKLRELVMRTRVASDDKVQSLFERKHGVGGMRMRVRHVVAMPNILRAEAVRAGTEPADIDMAAIRDQARQRAETARARLEEGADFAEIAREWSHDRVTKDRGGEIQNYNGRLYGPAFREAVDALQPGQRSAVIESGAGFHVVELLERTVTRFDEVRDALVDEVLAAEPSFQEMSSLRSALIAKAQIQLF